MDARYSRGSASTGKKKCDRWALHLSRCHLPLRAHLLALDRNKETKQKNDRNSEGIGGDHELKVGKVSDQQGHSSARE